MFHLALGPIVKVALVVAGGAWLLKKSGLGVSEAAGKVTGAIAGAGTAVAKKGSEALGTAKRSKPRAEANA